MFSLVPTLYPGLGYKQGRRVEAFVQRSHLTLAARQRRSHIRKCQDHYWVLGINILTGDYSMHCLALIHQKSLQQSRLTTDLYSLESYQTFSKPYVFPPQKLVKMGNELIYAIIGPHSTGPLHVPFTS